MPKSWLGLEGNIEGQVEFCSKKSDVLWFQVYYSSSHVRLFDLKLVKGSRHHYTITIKSNSFPQKFSQRGFREYLRMFQNGETLEIRLKFNPSNLSREKPTLIIRNDKLKRVYYYDAVMAEIGSCPVKPW